MAAVKQAKKICATYRAAGGSLTLYIESAMQGSALTTTRTIVLANTFGEFVTNEYDLESSDDPLEFVPIKFRLDAGAGVTGELQRLTIWARKVGTYINGNAGIDWDSGVLDL